MDWNYETLVSSADVQAARARARSLTSARYALEHTAGKTLAWEARYLQTPVPVSVDEFVSQRLENIRESIKQELKGHRSTITPRPAYRRSLNAANCELMSFREKFEEWKMTYDREISKTKASLASMTPALQGLGLAARFHKIAGRAAESLSNGGTSGYGETTPCNTVASTPRTLSDTIYTSTQDRESGSDSGMEPSLQPLHLDTDDLLSNRDEYPDFLDEDSPALLSERSGKLAELKEDIVVLTTIIEKKIFATHVNPNPLPEDDAIDVAEEALAVDLCAWSEGALTARTIKMAEHVPPDDDHGELPEAAKAEATATPEPIPPTAGPNLPKKVVVPKINYKANLGLDDLQPRPVNLRDNLIILAQQRGFTHVGTPVNECVPTLPSERERAMALLRKMYAPPPPPNVATPTPSTAEEPIATTTTTTTTTRGAIQPDLPANSELSPNSNFEERSAANRAGEVAALRNEAKASTENAHLGTPPNGELGRNLSSIVASSTSSRELFDTGDHGVPTTNPRVQTGGCEPLRELVVAT